MWLITPSPAGVRPSSNSATQIGVLDPSFGPEDLGAVGGGHGAQLVVPGAGPPEDRWCGELGGPPGRLRRIGDLEADGRNGRFPVPGLLLVEHDACVTGLPEPDGLGAVVAAEREAELGKHDLDRVGVLGLDLDEVEARRLVERQQSGEAAVRAEQLGRPVLQERQRAKGMHRRPGDVGLPEDVVEHLERQRARVPGAHHMGHELRQVEVTLARKEPVMPAPRQHVHAQQRRVGQLQEEDLLARYLFDGRRVVTAGQDVEAVQADPDPIMINKLDDPPGVTVVADEPAPGQRLVRDPYAVRLGKITEPTQLTGDELIIIDGGSAHIAADQDGVDAEPLHQRELGFGPPEVVGQLMIIDAFEVAERLVEHEFQAEPLGESADLLRRLRRHHQVGFEQLDAVESGGGARVHLLHQRAGQADRRSGLLDLAHHSATCLDQLKEVSPHPGRIGLEPGDQPERVDRLTGRHMPAVEHRRTESGRRRDQFGDQRSIDDVGDPQIGSQELGGTGSPG